MRSTVKVTGFAHDMGAIEDDLEKALDQIRWCDHIKTDSRVFVKPNYTLPFFKAGVTTHAHIVEALLGILKDRASEVYVGEADGGYDSFTAAYSLENHKVPEICKRTGATMVNLSRQERIRIHGVVNEKKVRLTLPKPLLEMDETISVPVLKTHVVTGVTLGFKNLWGCHPDTLRLLDHTNLAERLVLIAKLINLGLVVVDGIYGLNRRGPIEGDPVDVGVVLVGNNPVATDATGTRLMGFDPADIEHIQVASKEGLGPYMQDEIEICADLSQFQQEFCLEPSLVDRLGALTFKSDLLTKIVFDSPLTKPIYAFMGRNPKKKIVKPEDA